MIRKKITIFFVAIIGLYACSSKESRVISFMYGGYDTTFAILNGEVYQYNNVQGSKDSLQVLQGVTIKAEDSATGKIYTTTNTDATGRFSMNFFKNGTFKLTVTKEGYQPVKITNYLADTGQVSKVKIILEKDNRLF